MWRRSSRRSCCAETSSTWRSRSCSGRAFGPSSRHSSKDMLTPIIALIFGKPDFAALSFTINGSRFLYGDFMNTLIAFVSIAAGDLLLRRAARSIS